jgi:hypothetical protein
VHADRHLPERRLQRIERCHARVCCATCCATRCGCGETPGAVAKSPKSPHSLGVGRHGTLLATSDGARADAGECVGAGSSLPSLRRRGNGMARRRNVRAGCAGLGGLALLIASHTGRGAGGGGSGSAWTPAARTQARERPAHGSRHAWLRAHVLVVAALFCACCGGSTKSSPEPVPECQEYQQAFLRCTGGDAGVYDGLLAAVHNPKDRERMRQLCSQNTRRLRLACR